jgi:hypothetical protein
MIDDGLATKLLATTSITNLVSTRIYPVRAEQDTPAPLLVFSKVSASDRRIHHTGKTPAARSVFRFSCVGRTALEAKTLGDAVRAVFHGFKGSMGSDSVILARVLNEVDIDDRDLGIASLIDIEFFHKE